MSSTPRATSFMTGLMFLAGAVIGSANAAAPTVSRGADYVSPPSSPEKFHLDARTRPPIPAWKPGDPIREIPRQFHGEEDLQRNRPAPANPVTANIDVLAQLQRNFTPNGTDGFTTPLFNKDGASFNGVYPPDPSGDVGGGYYVEVYNGSGGAILAVYNTSDGNAAAPPFNMDGLGSGGPCASGLGDGVVVFDTLAQRWLFTEFSGSSNTLCVYLSSADNPVVTTWTRYTFNTPSFPDYPKYAVWPDAYYVGANEGPAVYALDRNRMLTGESATLQRKSVPQLGGLGFQMLPPVSVYGATPPPTGSPGIFMRDNDDERNSPGSNDPNHDFIEMFTLSVDFTTPGNTALSGPVQIPEDEFDSEFQVGGGFGAIHQPGTSQTIDPLLEVLMVPLQYRNFGDYESIVGNHVTRLPDDTTNNIAGVRWFELRRSGGVSQPWQLYQQGTYAPADDGGQISRWMAAVGMDSSGNMALGYSVARSPGVYPGLRYTGRKASDPLGVMTAPETSLVEGASSQTGVDRWGDYFGMGVDPSDGCTFWFTGMYMPAGGNWRTHFGAFKFDSCGTATFTASADNLSQDVCAATPVALDPVTITLAAQNGFADPVTMSFEPSLPTGFTGAFNPNPVTPPATTEADLSVDSNATPGLNTVTLRATSGDIQRDLQLAVNISTIAAAAPALTAPADAAIGVSSQPTFTWQPVAQAASYLIEIATDQDFANIILSQTVTTTTFTPSAQLPLGAVIYWRVTAANQCGSAPSPTFSFTTELAPGQCAPSIGTQTLFSDDVEHGINGWSHSADAGTDSWEMSAARASSPTHSWHVSAPSGISDQRLLSPSITLPTTLDGLTLQFENWRNLDSNASACRDGGILEVSEDGGVFSQVPASQMLTDPYTNPIASGSNNPLAGNPAWCGSQPFTHSVVDVSSHAGHSVQFRYRLGTNDSNSSEGWYIDDIVVQGCGATAPDDTIFADGFDPAAP